MSGKVEFTLTFHNKNKSVTLEAKLIHLFSVQKVVAASLLYEEIMKVSKTKMIRKRR
jgi:hypothetical protein